MKLRLLGNTVRLRLSRSEVQKLSSAGLLEETVEFSPSSFVYMLHSSKDCADIQVSFLNGWLTVTVPEKKVAEWAAGSEAGIHGLHRGVEVLIEKDWACAHSSAEGNDDTFPNPRSPL